LYQNAHFPGGRFVFWVKNADHSAMKACFYLLFMPGFLFMACQPSSHPASDDLLTTLLQNEEGVIKKVLERPEFHELQILYTQIDRDANQVPQFTSHAYRLNEEAYFYPASTVKLPAALLALEKLKELGIPRDTPLLIDSAFSGQTPALLDTTSESGLPSVAHYIRKIMLVSDNDAFNRLYEFLGQGPLNRRLWAKGYDNTFIRHRLSIFLTEEENRYTNPLQFVDQGQILYQQDLSYNQELLPKPAPILRGVGEMIDGKLIEGPKDFATKNAFPLEEQQRMLRAIIFPELAGEAGFDLNPDDYAFLYQAMSELPRESQWPVYKDTSYYYDSYVKFFLFGDQQTPMPDHIRVLNKVGVAYGYLTDNAYVVDHENGVEFFLSATLSVNENQIFNDGQYEYDELGFPFLAELGRVIYAYELQRTREYKPEFDWLDRSSANAK
jgi:hypothetical protein